MPPYNQLLGYFDPQVLAGYQNEPDKYRVETDRSHGKVVLTENYCRELEAAEKADVFINIPFGYRTLQDGSQAVVILLPDLFEKSKGHVQRWAGFRLTNPQWSKHDEAFGLWARRNLAGQWVGGPGVRSRLAMTVHAINSVTKETVERPLFIHELPADLSFPAAENSHRYQDAHEELYRYLIDGLDSKCIALIASHLSKPKPSGGRTVNTLKNVFPNLEEPAIFSTAYDLVSEQRRLASHNARPPAEAMRAFEQFTRDLELCVRGLGELLSTLEKELRMNSEKATARHNAKEHLPKIVAPASPHFSVCQASQMKGKTVDHVEFGFAEVTEYAHRSELLIIHFTDGSIMSIDTHTNAGNLADEVTGLKPKDFDVNYSLRWVPPK
jgi:hypothetical protein